MRLTVEAFAQQLKRIRRVVDHLGHHLDEDTTLSQLSELACLSPSRLERLYVTKLGETPFTTLRRLRLKRALAQIRQGQLALTDIGYAAGYASQSAFTRAFVRQFGYAPSRLPLITPADPRPIPLRLETLPEREVFQLDYSGIYRDSGREVDLMMGQLSVAGAKHWRTWRILDADRPLHAKPDDQVSVHYFVPAAGQPHIVRNVDRVVHGGALYAVCETLEMQRPRVLNNLIEQIRDELAHQYTGGRILRREITVNGYTAPQERRTAYYVPVAALRSKR